MRCLHWKIQLPELVTVSILQEHHTLKPEKSNDSEKYGFSITPKSRYLFEIFHLKQNPASTLKKKVLRNNELSES